jgi:tetratricopeptide (TPR) repeat protein
MLRFTDGAYFAFLIAGTLLSGGRAAAQDSSTSGYDRLMISGLGAFRANQFGEADRFYSAALAEARAANGRPLDVARALYGLGAVRKFNGHCDESVRMLSESIQIVEIGQGIGSAEMASMWQVLGGAYYCQHLYSNSINAYRRALAFADIPDPNGPPRVFEILSSLAVSLSRAGRVSEAESALDRARSMLTRDGHPDPVQMALLLNNYAAVRRAGGHGEEAPALLSEAIETLRSTKTPDTSLQAAIASNLGAIFQDRKQYERAAEYYRQGVELIDQGAPILPLDAAAVYQNYAACLRKCGRKAEARRLEARARTLLAGPARPAAAADVVDASSFTRRK